MCDRRNLLPSSLRATEFHRLDTSNQVYLDNTGAALYPSSLPINHLTSLTSQVLGNPHSLNPSSQTSSSQICATRSAILSFFNASSDEYTVIFTANASGAIKLVGESYPFSRHSTLLLSKDNHNSVVGIREYARQKHARINYIPLTKNFTSVNMESYLKKAGGGGFSLLAYPAQSNFTGVKHDLENVKKGRLLGWDVLLDCAAYVGTNKLDLKQIQADFIPISFYKMFGYPTGIGALIVRKEKLPMLKRPSFTGGTIQMVSTVVDGYILNQGLEGFEDGTVNFAAINAVRNGIEFLQTIGIEKIKSHVMELSEFALKEMKKLRHANGMQVLKIYGSNRKEERSGVIAFQVLKSDGERIDVRVIEKLAAEIGISLRTGCFCNPGVGETVFGLEKSRKLIRKCMKRVEIVGGGIDTMSRCVGMGYLGNIRVSFGIGNIEDDVCKLIKFLNKFVEGE